jgi:hypothetical protein
VCVCVDVCVIVRICMHYACLTYFLCQFLFQRCVTAGTPLLTVSLCVFLLLSLLPQALETALQRATAELSSKNREFKALQRRVDELTQQVTSASSDYQAALAQAQLQAQSNHFAHLIQSAAPISNSHTVYPYGETSSPQRLRPVASLGADQRSPSNKTMGGTTRTAGAAASQRVPVKVVPQPVPYFLPPLPPAPPATVPPLVPSINTFLREPTTAGGGGGGGVTMGPTSHAWDLPSFSNYPTSSGPGVAPTTVTPRHSVSFRPVDDGAGAAADHGVGNHQRPPSSPSGGSVRGRGGASSIALQPQPPPGGPTTTTAGPPRNASHHRAPSPSLGPTVDAVVGSGSNSGGGYSGAGAGGASGGGYSGASAGGASGGGGNSAKGFANYGGVASNTGRRRTGVGSDKPPSGSASAR